MLVPTLTAPPGIRLLALDVDGTLAHEEGLPPREVVRALRRVAARGIEIALVTGRPLHAMRGVASLLGLPRVWVAASNGAVGAKLEDGTWTSSVITTLETGPLIRRARAIDPSIGVAAEEPGVGYRVTRPLPTAVAPAPQLPWAVGPDEAPFVALASQAVPSRDLIEALEDLGHQMMPWSCPGFEVVDVHPAGTDKGTAVKELAEQLGLDASQVAAVGDYLNDIPLLAWTGWSVAMGHAPVEVRLTATAVTGTLEEDGLMAVLDALSR